jgi:hypothetical protein
MDTGFLKTSLSAILKTEILKSETRGLCIQSTIGLELMTGYGIWNITWGI